MDSLSPKKEKFSVKVKLKDLGKLEIRAFIDHYESVGYIDVGAYQNTKDFKEADWKKAMAQKEYSKTQNDELSPSSVAAQELISIANRNRHPNEGEEQRLWSSIKGVYNRTSPKSGARRILFILKK